MTLFFRIFLLSCASSDIIVNMFVQIAVAKTRRHDLSASKETVEIIERPSGGQSVIFCRGIRSGIKSKTISSIIVNQIIEKVAEGERDGSSIRNVSDQIHRQFSGEATGSCCMMSVDFESGTLVVSRLTSTPVWYYQRGELNAWSMEAAQLGSDKGLHPSITEIPIETGSSVLFLSSGLLHAGKLSHYDTEDFSQTLSSLAEDDLSAQAMADFILNHAVAVDMNSPRDDMTVVVMRVMPGRPDYTRLSLSCPVPEYRQEINSFGVFF